jgi:Flp pilus assembly protein TadG
MKQILWDRTKTRLFGVFRERIAGAALIVALALPLLIGATALCVDCGYWYQQQESLQTAADAAALAAARNNAAGAASNSNAGAALAAAKTATNNQFPFTSASTPAAYTIVLTPGTVSGTTTYAATAVATIPRGSFFSKKGGALLGIAPGLQSASATVAVTTVAAGPKCLRLNGAANGNALFASGGARINSPNCGIEVDSTACNANNGDSNSISVEPSAQLIASNIATSGCAYVNTNGGAYLGGTNRNTAVVTQHATATADPLAALGTPPPWPTTPNAPAAPAGTTYTAAPSLGYNLYSGAAGDCIYMGTYSANCELYQGAYSGMNSVGVASLVLNAATSSGTTYVTGGLTVAVNNFMTFNGSSYFVAGGMKLTENSNTANINASILNILGGTQLQNGSWNFGVNNTSNIYYFTGAANSSGTITGWGMNVSAPTLNFGPGTYYVNGGATFPGSNPTVNFGQGTYLYTAYSSSSGVLNTNSGGASTNNGAFNDKNATINFTGGTYYFNGGLSIVGNSTITFGPGIYYIENGNLSFGSGSAVTANGATFVLEGNASYQLDGGTAALNLSAPSTNCVAPANYPNTTNVLPSSATAVPNASYAPYDGTNGEGICDVLIYQARGDSTADTVSEGATTTLTGIIYAPSASLTISGGATISSSISNGNPQTLALIQDTLTMTGSGTLNISVAPNDPYLSNAAAPSTGIILTN